MALTKSYYTIDGQIIGEATGGTRTGYLPDALGSVTATVDETGAIVNTYRYKPYGSQLSKTGGGADPHFQWVGQRGYRFSNQAVPNTYIRARHLSSTQGNWLSADPFAGSLNKSIFIVSYIKRNYGYVIGNPVNHIDPFGLNGTNENADTIDSSGNINNLEIRSCITAKIRLDRFLKHPIFIVLKPALKFSKCRNCYSCECSQDCFATMCEKISAGFCLEVSPFEVSWADFLGILEAKDLFNQIANIITAITAGGLQCLVPEKKCIDKSIEQGGELCGSFCNLGFELWGCLRCKSGQNLCTGDKYGGCEVDGGGRLSNCGIVKLEICLSLFSKVCD